MRKCERCDKCHCPGDRVRYKVFLISRRVTSLFGRSCTKFALLSLMCNPFRSANCRNLRRRRPLRMQALRDGRHEKKQEEGCGTFQHGVAAKARIFASGYCCRRQRPTYVGIVRYRPNSRSRAEISNRFHWHSSAQREMNCVAARSI